MVKLVALGLAKVLGKLRGEKAQDAFEYVLIVGGVSVAVVAAVTVITGLAQPMIDATCNGIATLPGLEGMECGGGE
jgi:hypothetical protein